MKLFNSSMALGRDNSSVAGDSLRWLAMALRRKCDMSSQTQPKLDPVVNFQFSDIGLVVQFQKAGKTSGCNLIIPKSKDQFLLTKMVQRKDSHKRT